jgi:hypothetical protein
MIANTSGSIQPEAMQRSLDRMAAIQRSDGKTLRVPCGPNGRPARPA